MKNLFFTFFISVIFFSKASSQNAQLSVFSEISIITSGPGDALYEKFGHTAIRVKDPALKLDLLYNYGMFDSSGADFYFNFTKGYMQYKLARYPFKYALQSAKRDKRWVKQQVLNVSVVERNKIFRFLELNHLPQNASYLYDPFFDNCATRPRDIIDSLIGKKVIWKEINESKSIRTLMNNEISQNTWGSFGINTALGSKIDKIATTKEYMYLPDHLEKSLDSAQVINSNGKEIPLINKKRVIYNFKEKKSKSSIFSPFTIFSMLLLLVGYITYKDFKKETRSRWLDSILFSITGVLGMVILFLWFFTNHSTAPDNFNILWAFPINIVAILLLKKKQSQFKKYIIFLLVLLVLLPIIWITKIQQFTWVFIPLYLALLLRYIFLLTSKKQYGS